MNHVHLRAEKMRHQRQDIAQRAKLACVGLLWQSVLYRTRLIVAHQRRIAVQKLGIGAACIALLARSMLYRARLTVLYMRNVYEAQRKIAQEQARIAAMKPAKRRRFERRAAGRAFKANSE